MTLQVYKDFESIPIEDLNSIIPFDQEGIYQYFRDPFTFNVGIAKLNNKVVGAGIVRVVNEFKMTINQDLSKVTRAKILRELMDKALELRQCKEIVVSLTLPKNHKDRERYAKIIETHYDFWLDPGVIMRKEF